jgi:peptide deformylase
LRHEADAEFPAMAILPIREAPDPRLRLIITLVQTIDDGLRTLLADMFEQLSDAPKSGWPFNRS